MVKAIQTMVDNLLSFFDNENFFIEKILAYFLLHLAKIALFNLF